MTTTDVSSAATGAPLSGLRSVDELAAVLASGEDSGISRDPSALLVSLVMLDEFPSGVSYLAS